MGVLAMLRQKWGDPYDCYQCLSDTLLRQLSYQFAEISDAILTPPQLCHL